MTLTGWLAAIVIFAFLMFAISVTLNVMEDYDD